MKCKVIETHYFQNHLPAQSANRTYIKSISTVGHSSIHLVEVINTYKYIHKIPISNRAVFVLLNTNGTNGPLLLDSIYANSLTQKVHFERYFHSRSTSRDYDDNLPLATRTYSNKRLPHGPLPPHHATGAHRQGVPQICNYKLNGNVSSCSEAQPTKKGLQTVSHNLHRKGIFVRII